MTDPAAVARRLRRQARACRVGGSSLYGELLDAAAGGPTWAALGPHRDASPGSALALRLMAAVHRLVLAGEEPGLAAHYPSAGGDAGRSGAWEALRDLLVRRGDELSALTARPLQTNEPGRSAALVGGFLLVAAGTRLPLRVRELGASAGLNLHWDRFRYEAPRGGWGRPTRRSGWPIATTVSRPRSRSPRG